MGSSLSTSFSQPPSTLQLQVKDVLALCEDGDLLLAREKLADAALRVGVDFVVARDIQRMQRAWTSCEILLRHEGTLHVVTVGASGLQLLPFEGRIASKMPQIHDRFAIRRLRYDAHNESLSAALRDLVPQIASVAPISWHSLLFPSAKVKMSPKSPRQQPVDREAVAGVLKELPPLVRQMLRRMLELFCQGLKQCEVRAEDDTTRKLQHQNNFPPQSEHAGDKSIDSLDHKNAPSKVEDEASTALRAALETLGVAEVTARLSAAFVAALYEHIHLVDRISANRGGALLPAAFWSGCDDHERLIFTPPTAVGTEMALARPTLEQNTYSLAK